MKAAPAKAANRLLGEYFRVRGRFSPEEEARRALREITHRRGRCVAARDIDRADEVLRHACFDVDDVAENFLRVELRIESLARFDSTAGAPVFGFARPQRWQITICERAERYMPLYRTTVMHELGHLLLHGNRNDSPSYSPRSPVRPAYEIEADEFMLRAILPRSVLSLAMFRSAAWHDLSIVEAIRGANTERGRWQYRQYYLPELVSQLCVSRELLCNTLTDLHLFTAETRQYHLSYAMPNRWKASTSGQSLQPEVASMQSAIERLRMTRLQAPQAS